MNTLFIWIVAWFSLRNVSPLVKILHDSESRCAGLICDYSSVTWKEKTEILDANNDLRNKIAAGKYNSVMVASNVNKLAWSEKLFTLAQDEANKCPDSKVWTYVDKFGRCEYASSKRSKSSNGLPNKYLKFFIETNQMFDIQTDSRTKQRTLRRASATAIGCGYVVRHYKEEFIDHFVCLYCYLHRGTDVRHHRNHSCHHDCIYENFTCDHHYDRLCSYDNKDGSIDKKQRANALCPNVNLLTGTILFWNFMGNSFLCLLASGFLATTLVLAVALIAYIFVKNYRRRWRKLIKKDTNAEAELSMKEKNPFLSGKADEATPSTPTDESYEMTAKQGADIEGRKPARPMEATVVARKFSSEHTKYDKDDRVSGNKENDESTAQMAKYTGSQGSKNDLVTTMAKTSHVLCIGDRPSHRNKERQFKSRIELELNVEANRLSKRKKLFEKELINCK